MTIREIMKLLDAQVLCCEDALDSEVVDAFSCDMMSDVLAFATNGNVAWRIAYGCISTSFRH